MASSLAVHHHGLKLKSGSGTRSPKYMSTSSSSDDVATNASSPRSGERPCLCSPTTHEGSFRCRLHRSSPGYWGKKPLPTPTPPPTPTANSGVHKSVEGQ